MLHSADGSSAREPPQDERGMTPHESVIEELSNHPIVQHYNNRRRSRRNRSEGKRLRVTVRNVDCGKPGRQGTYDNWLASTRLLQDNSKVYSTDPRNEKRGNFHISFVPEDDVMHSVCHRYDDDHSLTGHKKFSWDNRVITPTLFKVCIPLNYDNPLGKGLLFVLNDFSEMESTKLWNDCDRKGYEGYVAKRGALEDSDPTMLLEAEEQAAVYMKGTRAYSGLKLDGLCSIVAAYATDTSVLQSPVAYFDMFEGKANKSSKTFAIDFPRSGKIIVMKMIDARKREGTSSGVPPTIDIRHIAFYE